MSRIRLGRELASESLTGVGIGHCRWPSRAAQLPGVGGATRARTSAAADAEQAVDAAAEAVEHQFPEAERQSDAREYRRRSAQLPDSA